MEVKSEVVKSPEVVKSDRSVQEVLDAMAVRLATPGVWTQGQRSLYADCDCLATAAATCGYDGLSRSEKIEIVARMCKAIDGKLSEVHPTSWLAIINWNDDPSRTLPEVLAAIQRAKEVEEW